MKNQRSLVAVMSVFFFWGFLAASNGVFIPFCKNHFKLSQFQSQLIDSAFYGAYFTGALLLLTIKLLFKIDFIQKVGFKFALIGGIGLSVAGAILMIPALEMNSLNFIMISFFTIALGFSLQQTTANPLTLLLGDPHSGSKRLNLAGGINSIGTTVGPLVVGQLLFGNAINGVQQEPAVEGVVILYKIFALLFGCIGFILVFTLNNKALLDLQPNEEETTEKDFSVWSFLKQNVQLRWGMAAIFVYVGVEVTIQSNLGALIKNPEYGSISGSLLASFISLYWGGLMVGRWMAGSSLVEAKKWIQWLIIYATAYAAFGVVLLSNVLNHKDIQPLIPFAWVIFPFVTTYAFYRHHPLLAFRLFAIFGSIALGLGLLLHGNWSIIFLLSSGISCSIMWPGIYATALNGLKGHAGFGSSLLIMMVLGGACLPPTQGLISDWAGIKISYLLPLMGFVFLAIYAIQALKFVKNQQSAIE